MKKPLFHWFSAALLALGSLSLHAAPQPLDRVVAVVNKDVVLQSELDNLLTKVQRDAQRHNQALPPWSSFANKRWRV